MLNKYKAEKDTLGRSRVWCWGKYIVFGCAGYLLVMGQSRKILSCSTHGCFWYQWFTVTDVLFWTSLLKCQLRYCGCWQQCGKNGWTYFDVIAMIHRTNTRNKYLEDRDVVDRHLDPELFSFIRAVLVSRLFDAPQTRHGGVCFGWVVSCMRLKCSLLVRVALVWFSVNWHTSDLSCMYLLPVYKIDPMVQDSIRVHTTLLDKNSIA